MKKKEKISSGEKILIQKRMGFLSYLGILFILLLIFIVGAGIYFYNYHVFETIRICEGAPTDTEIFCETVGDCREALNIDSQVQELDELPEFLKSPAKNIFEKSLYCEGTCWVRSIRGINFETKDFESIDKCNSDEEEEVVILRGKEILEVFKYLKNSQ